MNSASNSYNKRQEHLDQTTRNTELEKENQALQRRIKQLELVHDIGKQINLLLELDSILTQITQAAAGITNAEVSTLMLVDERSGDLYLRAKKMGGGTHAYSTNEIIIDKLAEEAVLKKIPLRFTSQERILKVVTGYIVRAVLYVPIKVDKKVIGVLSVHNETRDRSFSNEDEIFLVHLSEYAGIAIQNSEWLKKEKNLRLQTELLREAAIEISSAANLEQLGKIILNTLSRVLEFKKATVQIFDDLHSERRLVAFEGFNEQEIDLFLLRPIAQDRLAQRVFEERKPVILSDPNNDPDWDGDRHFTNDVKSWIGLPLIHNNPLGFITLDHNKPGYYTESLSSLLGMFCSQTAAVIENLNLLKSEQRQKALFDALSDTAMALNTAQELDDVLSVVLQKVELVVPHETANIMLIEHGRARIAKTNGYSNEEVTKLLNLQIIVDEYETFTTMHQTCKPLLIPNVIEYSGWKDLPEMPPVQSFLGSPICVADQVIGFLNLNSVQSAFFSDIHIKRIQAFVGQIAVAIRRSRLLENSRQQTMHMEILNGISKILSNKLNAEDLLQSVVDQVATNLNCAHCTLFEYSQETKDLAPRVVSGTMKQTIDRHFKLGEGIVGWVFQNGESVLASDVTNDPRFAPARKQKTKPRSMIAAPIKTGEHTIGVICADQDEYGWFDETGKNLVEMLGKQSGIAIERAKGLDLLHEITNNMVSLVTRNDVLKNIVSGAIRLTNTSTGIIYLLSANISGDKREYAIEDSFKYPEKSIHPKPRLENEDGLTRTIIRERKHIVISDITKLPISHPNILINQELKKNYSSMLGMPLIYAGDVIGVLYVHDENRREFTEVQISLVSTLAQLAAIAIRNARFFDNMERKNQELNVLNQIGQHVSTRSFLNSLDLSEVGNELLNFVYNQTISLMDLSNFYIAFWDEQSEHTNFEFVRERGEPVNFNTNKDWAEREHGNYITEYVARVKKPLLLQNNIKSWMSENRVDTNGEMAKSWLGVPMLAGTKVIGVIAVQSYEKENAFSDQDSKILQSIASQTAIAIENSRLYAEVQANNRMLGLLQQANNILIGSQQKDIREILQAFLMETSQAANAKWLAIVLIDENGILQDIIHSSTDITEDIKPRDSGYSTKIWETGESQIIPDVKGFIGEIPLHPLISTFSVKAALGLPWTANGKIIGVVWLYYDTIQNFSMIEEKTIRAHFDQAAFIYLNYKQIKEQYKQRESMFTTLAHEIEIPLVSLAGTANALNEETGELGNKKITQMALKLIEQSQKLELQNETILAMYGRQNKPISFRKHSIYRPIMKARELFQNTASRRGCQIKLPKASNGSFPDIEMSEHHLTLAFQNLISNAVKYSYSVKSGVNAERYIVITGNWEKADLTRYTISIQNYGVGIDPHEINSGRIFQPFERGKYSGDRGRPGKGLGLALVWHVVVVMHHGTIDVISQQVPGGAYLTTFSVTLPLIKQIE